MFTLLYFFENRDGFFVLISRLLVFLRIIFIMLKKSPWFSLYQNLNTSKGRLGQVLKRKTVFRFEVL